MRTPTRGLERPSEAETPPQKGYVYLKNVKILNSTDFKKIFLYFLCVMIVFVKKFADLTP